MKTISTIQPRRDVACYVSTLIQPRKNVMCNVRELMRSRKNVACNVSNNPDFGNVACNVATLIRLRGDVACNVSTMLILLFFVLMSFNVNAQTVITTAAQLDAVRNNLSGNYILGNDIDLSGYTNWTPIGKYSNSKPFKGTFDGNNKKIKGLKITSSSSSRFEAGLFGYVNGGTVKNLGVENVTITVTGSGYKHVAGAVGDVRNGLVENCWSSGVINCTVSDVNATTGGVVGYVVNSTVTKCYSTASVSGTCKARSGRYAATGGVAGGIEDNSTLSNSYSTGVVSGYATANGDAIIPLGAYSHAYTGGLVGNIEVNSTVSNCYSTGSVNSKATATGNLDTEAYAYSGGIVGRIEASSGKVTKCYSTAAISSEALVSITLVGTSKQMPISGGIAGVNKGTVSDCAALNQKIECWAVDELLFGTKWEYHIGQNFGRVAGSNSGTLSNNIAFDKMVNHYSNTTWNGSGANHINGLGWTKEDINLGSTFGSRFTSANGWTTQTYRLPGLFGNILPIPLHLFIAVTNITGVPNTATATLPLTLSGTVLPNIVTNGSSVTWSVQDKGTTGATITGNNILNTTGAGTVIVRATIVNGKTPTDNYTQDFYITVKRATLSGTVSITGNTEFGQSLTANTTGLTSNPVISNRGALSYQWRRGTTNISGATSSTYTPVQTDIGSQLSVVVTAANCDGNVTSSGAGPVMKATPAVPAPPTLAASTPTGITLNPVSGCVYNIDGGIWQTSTVFTGLQPNTSYMFTQRLAETNTHLVSGESEVATFTTPPPTYVPVTTITNVPTTAWATVPLTLSGTVTPGNATNKAITWSVVNQGATGATITDGYILNTTGAGTVTLLATIKNGHTETDDYTQYFNITVSLAGLAGAVSITGDLVFGETLTVDTEGLTSNPVIPDLGAFTYQWQRGTVDIIGATSASYTLEKDDIGSYIGVVVTAANCNGDVSSINTVSVTKAIQTAPVTPSLAATTPTSITLNAVSGCEYSINGSTWQTSPVFEGLAPGITYIFTQRLAETDTHFESPDSPTASFTTPIVPVTNITLVSTTATASLPLVLTGMVAPGDATNQTIEWCVQNAGTTGAIIIGDNLLNTTSSGYVTVRAIIENGTGANSDYEQDFNITVYDAPTTDIDLSNNNPAPAGIGWTFENNVYTIEDGAEVTVTGTSANQRRIEVAEEATASITLNGVTIEGLGNNQSPLLLNNNANVTLTLEGVNKLTAGNDGAGIQTTDASLTIDGTGILTATGGNGGGAGIGDSGGSSSEGEGNGGTITILSGTVNAIGNSYSVGIGSSGSITITGGVVTANGGNYGAGIGSSGSITITGGVVTATGGNYGVGIGSSGSITITGGVVTANGGSGGKGIGDGTTLTMNGNAVVFASSISDMDESRRTNGILFIGANATGLFYGANVTITDDVTIPGNYSLIIPDDKSLTIPAGRTLINYGIVHGCGTINRGGVYGAWSGNEPLPCGVVVVNNGTANGNHFAAGETVAITANTPPEGQYFINWTANPVIIFADANSPTTTFTMPAGAVTVTANFEDIPAASYAITVSTDGNGTAIANATVATPEMQITLMATANNGYRFKEWQVISGDITLDDATANPVTFTMPNHAVEVRALFEVATNNLEISPANPLKAWSRNGLLHITGLSTGKPLNIYSISGALVYNSVASSDAMDIPLRTQGMKVIVIQSGNNTIKVFVE